MGEIDAFESLFFFLFEATGLLKHLHGLLVLGIQVGFDRIPVLEHLIYAEMRRFVRIFKHVITQTPSLQP